MLEVCKNCDRKFEVEDEDLAFYAKIKVPTPTRCPRCRMKRRMAFLNQRHLFKHVDAQSGEQVFSAFPSEAKFTIYQNDYWYGDNWDTMSYGRNYDFNRSFFEQFDELQREVPFPARHVRDLVDSEYCNNVNNLKDCYLCFDGNSSENCRYLVSFANCRDSMDLYQCSACELSYELFSASTCYRSYFSTELLGCSDIWFSRDLSGCESCFGCANLKNKKYYIFNKAHTKEEYADFMAKLDLSSFRGLMEAKDKAEKFTSSLPYRFMHGTNNENVVGEYVYNSHNAKYCYQGLNMENVKFLQNMGGDIRDSYDYTNWGGGAELVYEAISAGFGISQVRFSYACADSVSNLDYCISIVNSHNLFGCVGLRAKQYCILNKQYTKEDYLAIRERIIAQMKQIPYVDSRGKTYGYGEFFPPEMSSINYRQSLAADFYPLTDAEIVAEGYRPGEIEANQSKISLHARELPDSISNISSEIYKESIGCIDCGKPYRIVAGELALLVKFGIAAPRKCIDCRYEDRIRERNPLNWWPRNCMKESCHISFKTSYPPESKKVIYCNSCYEAELL